MYNMYRGRPYSASAIFRGRGQKWMKNDDGWVYKSADIGEGSLKNSKKVLTYFMDGPHGAW